MSEMEQSHPAKIQQAKTQQAKTHRVKITDLDYALNYMKNPEAATLIPHLLPGLRRYLEDHIETGGFLRACLENNWTRAVRLAPPSLTMPRMKALQDVIMTFPPDTWGSEVSVRAWLQGGELIG